MNLSNLLTLKSSFCEKINNGDIIIPKEKLVFWTLALVLTLIAGLRPVGFDRDSSGYAYFVLNDIRVNYASKEPLFWAIKWFNDIFFKSNIHTFFLIFASLGIFLKFYAIKKISKFPWLSVAVYVSIYFILHEMTQIRAGVAVGIFLLSIPDILHRRYVSYIAKIVLASLFHYSALIALPLYLLSNSKKLNILFLLLPLLGFLFAYFDFSKELLYFLATLLPNFISLKINGYLNLLTTGVHTQINIFNLYHSSLYIILCFCFYLYYERKNVNIEHIFFTKALSVMLFTFYFFSPIPVFAFRLSEFLGTILILYLPNLLLGFEKRCLALLAMLVGLGYMFTVEVFTLLDFSKLF